MAGNIWEWCADWYDGDYYGKSPAKNPLGPDTGEYRVLRGGFWFDDLNFLYVTYRDNHPSYSLLYRGFRCNSRIKII